MITIHELLKDPAYKQFFRTPPKLPEVARRSPPWQVLVQFEHGGRWYRREFLTYAEAFGYFRHKLPDIHDGAIRCKRVSFEPPTRYVRIKGKFVTGSDGVRRQATKLVFWRPKLDGDDERHRWCPYCRRPTVFRWFSKHHAMRILNPAEMRCAICGASENLTSRRFQ